MHNNEFFGCLIRFCGRIQEILAVILWVLLIYGFDKPYLAGLTILAALVHECGHFIFMNWKVKGKFKAAGRLSGPKFCHYAYMNYGSEILLYLSGAFANILAAAIALPFVAFNGYFSAFFAINLATALTNLLPLWGHDGRGAALAALRMLSAPRGAFIILRTACTAATAFGCILGLFLLLRAGDGYWLFAIFYFSLLSELFAEEDMNF